MLRREAYETSRKRACSVAAALLEAGGVSKKEAARRAPACVRSVGLVKPVSGQIEPRLLSLSLFERELQYDFGEARIRLLDARPKPP